MENRPKIGVGGVVLKDDKVLLGKRKNAHGAGSWCFPGGHLEFGESIEECARREVAEETCITIKNLKIGPYTNDIFKEESKHYVTLYMISDYNTGEVKLMEPDKCETWDWFSWNMLPKPLFLPIQNLIKLQFNPIDFSVGKTTL